MILAGDIGGTKSLFGLFEDGRCVLERRLANADFPDFTAVVAAFLASAPTTRFDAACLALAGPIADDGRRARLTNLPWDIDADALEARFGLPTPRLVNDFAAAAQGAVVAAPDRLHTLQAGQPLPSAPRLVVGAGTGLGMALVLPEAGGGWRIVPGEGGHVAFAPADEEQRALWQHLRQRHGRVTWERVASGPGLAAIHECLHGTVATPKAIGDEALRAPDSAAATSLRLFLRCYGAYAGDMALAALARGGVLLAGGIAARILPALSGPDFLAAFNDKHEHADIAAAMPVHVALDPALGLHGAARLARTSD